MAIQYLDDPVGIEPPAPEQEELTFQQKLKAIADKPTRDLTWVETAAVSAPGRAILGIAERMGANPISRGVVSERVNMATVASDVYLSATQKGYEVVGMEDAVKEVEVVRRKVQGFDTELAAFNARQDKQFVGGETTARILRGAAGSISGALTAHGIAGSKGNSLMAQYYAARATQESIRKNPDDWQTAMTHGLLDGVSTGLGGYIGVPTSTLAGTAGPSTNRLMARAVARVKSRVPLPESAIRGAFGTAIETGSEVLTDMAHYFADVAAGVEKLDWNVLSTRLAEVGATAGLAGATATGVQPVVDAMRQRHEMLPALLGEEAKSKHNDLLRREMELGLVKLPEVSTEPDAEGRKPSKADMEAKRADAFAAFQRSQAETFDGLGLEKQLFDLAVREERAMSMERDIDRYTKPTSAGQRELKKALGERRVEQIGQGEKAIENTPDGDVDFDRVRNAPLRAGDTKPEAIQQAIVSDDQAQQQSVDAELAFLHQMEREVARLRDATTPSQLAGSMAATPDTLTPDLLKSLVDQREGMEATIAERLTQMAERYSDPGQLGGDPALLSPRTRAQRHTEAKRQKLQARRRLAHDSASNHYEAMKEFLPPGQRWALKQAAKAVNTPVQYEQWKTRVEKAADEFDRKIAKDSLAAAMAKAAKYATRPEDRSTVETILADVDTSTRSVHNQAKALVDWVKDNPGAAVPAGYQQALEQAEKRHTSELSADETRELAEAIEAVAARSQAAKTFQTMATDATHDEYAANVVSQIQQKRPKDSGAVGETVAKAANIVFRPETIMASLSEDLRVLAWENIGIEGHRNYLSFQQAQLDDMDTLLRSIGLAPDRVVGATGQGGSALNVWRYAQRSIGGQKLTRAEAAHLYALSLDPEARQMLEAGGATLQKTRKLRKKDVQIAINDGTLREIGDFLGAEGRRVVEHGFARINTTMRDATNAQWLTHYNTVLSERNDYFPIRRDGDWVMENKTADMFLADLEQTVKDSYGEFNITKARKANVLSPLEVGDFFDVYAKHVDTTARVHGYMGPVRDFFAVYGKAEVKRAVTNATHDSVYDGILEAVKQQVLPVRDRDSFSAAARKLVHGSGAAILGLRIVTPFKNALGLINARAQYAGGELLFAEAIAEAADPRNLQRMEALLQTHSPVWRQRTGNYLNEATSGVGGDSRAFQPSGIADATLAFVSAADKLAGLIRGLAVEKVVQRNLGIDPKDARFAGEVAKEWERLLARTESTSNGLEMSGAQRAGKRHGVVASLTQFGSGASKTLSLLQSGRNDIRDGHYKQGVRKLAYFGAVAVTDAVIGAMFAATAAAQEEEIVDRVAGSLARLVPGIGEIVNQAYRKARGLKTFSGPQDSLTSIGSETIMATADIYKMVESYLTNGLTDEGDPQYHEHAMNAAKKLSLLVGSIYKLPTEGVQDIAKRLANGLGITGEGRELLAKVVSDANKATDIDEPKGKLRAAIKTNDDELFLEAIEEIQTQFVKASKEYPGTKQKQITMRTMEDAVNGLFRDIEKFEKNPELLMRLDNSGLRAIRYAVEQRTAMRSTLRDMLERNLGQIEKIVAVKS